MPDFVARTNVDLVAVTIGNVHGRYAVQPPQLDLPRLDAIRKATDRCGGVPPSLSLSSLRVAAWVMRDAPPIISIVHMSLTINSLLVLHGASGLPPPLVRETIARGVCKFNVNTEVREAAMRVVRGG